MEPKEVEPKGEKVVEVGWHGGGSTCELTGRGQCQTYREHLQQLARSKDQPQTT